MARVVWIVSWALAGVAFAAVAATQQADDVIAWLIRYPLLPLQVGVILLAS